MYIGRSLIVILCLLAVGAYFAFSVYRCISSSKKEKRLSAKVAITVLMGIITLMAFSLLWEYTYPFEQTVELQLVEVVEIPSEHTMSRPRNLPWHAAYERYGLWPGSRYFDAGQKEDRALDIVWPDMDFEHYTYIISYGQEVESLSYNVWETITAPMPNGAKVGHAKLSEEFDPNAIYVYRIKKMRIDNNQ